VVVGGLGLFEKNQKWRNPFPVKIYRREQMHKGWLLYGLPHLVELLPRIKD